MNPTIKFVTRYGLVTAVTSEGWAIYVEIVDEGAGGEIYFPSRDKGSPDVLYLPAPS